MSLQADCSSDGDRYASKNAALFLNSLLKPTVTTASGDVSRFELRATAIFLSCQKLGSRQSHGDGGRAGISCDKHPPSQRISTEPSSVRRRSPGLAEPIEAGETLPYWPKRLLPHLQAPLCFQGPQIRPSATSRLKLVGASFCCACVAAVIVFAYKASIGCLLGRRTCRGFGARPGVSHVLRLSRLFLRRLSCAGRKRQRPQSAVCETP